jgi:hypothetical protein
MLVPVGLLAHVARPVPRAAAGEANDEVRHAARLLQALDLDRRTLYVYLTPYAYSVRKERIAMKAVTQDGYCGPDELRLEEVPKPEIADDEVLVKVQAASVNPFDWQ